MTRQTAPADINLTGFALRHRMQLVIEQIDRTMLQRPT
jgi:hypothetical protein